MSDDIAHECGIAALYFLNDSSKSLENQNDEINFDTHNVVELMPQILLDLQNRGQLAAGISSFMPSREQVLKVYKDIGTVQEVFFSSNEKKYQRIINDYSGIAALGHTRYSTSGQDDARYAQPFERSHGRLWKWFTFAFNGNLANFTKLRDDLKNNKNYHFSLNNDTELIMYMLAHCLNKSDTIPSLCDIMKSLSQQFDGAYNLVFLDAMGRMFISRDPLGLRPMNWAVQGNLFGAASESSALIRLGFENVNSLEPGQMAIIEDGKLRFEYFSNEAKRARCFFEWIYFSNISSIIDSRSVYLSRAKLGQRLAESEDQKMDEDCIAVPVPDTASTAAYAYAYHMRIRPVEGIIRNRYVGRTFIQSNSARSKAVKSKYTPLPYVLKGKRVFLIEDSIVRATTLLSLVNQLKVIGGAKEVHVRVACPPIISPCFYGIDMSTFNELFAPNFITENYNDRLNDDILSAMASSLNVDSLKYASFNDISIALDTKLDSLCTACISCKYPTEYGEKLRALAAGKVSENKRTYE